MDTFLDKMLQVSSIIIVKKPPTQTTSSLLYITQHGLECVFECSDSIHTTTPAKALQIRDNNVSGEDRDRMDLLESYFNHCPTLQGSHQSPQLKDPPSSEPT